MPLKLSICVPSRNRQIYFQETIRALLACDQADVEFVFADNSDDPSIMNRFMAGLTDPRIVYLPSTGSTLSMVDNWERTMAASSGDWISFIGDDDYLDPELVVLLQRLVAAFPGLDALDWAKLHFHWPETDAPLPGNMALPLSGEVLTVDRATTLKRAWQWQEATHAPVNGFSIYHAAISRRVMEAIRGRFGGRYFEHATVDYDSSLKVSLVAQSFMASRRPFSVMGVCPLSNSGGLTHPARYRQRLAEFNADLGRDIDEEPYLKGLPFPAMLGVPAVILQVQHFIKSKYGVAFAGWEANFAAACARSCSRITDRAFYDLTAAGYRTGFARYDKGRHLKHFNPVYRAAEERSGPVFSGLRDGTLYVSMPLLNPRTPGALFDVAGKLMPSAGDMMLPEKA